MTQQQRLFHTINIKTATALLTLGFEKVAITKSSQNGRESIVFWFNSSNTEGLQAESVHHGMTTGADALLRKDPENSVNYMRCFASNRDELISDIKKTPRMVVIEKDGRKVAISEHATEETKRQIAAMI
jgi:hypothetical protein